MSKEKNPLLNINLSKKRNILINFYINISESLYSLFVLILEDPIENFWFEIFNIIFGYFQLFAYLFDSTVSIYLIIYNKFYSFIQFGIKI